MQLKEALKVSAVEAKLNGNNESPQARRFFYEDLNEFEIKNDIVAGFGQKKYIIAWTTPYTLSEILYNVFYEDGIPVTRNPLIYYGTNFLIWIEKNDWEPI